MNGSGRLKSRLLLLSWAIALGIGVLVAVQLLESRSAVWQRASAANTNLVYTVSRLLEDAMHGADHALLHSVTMVETFGTNIQIANGASMRPGADPARLLFPSVPTGRYGIQLILDHAGAIGAAARPPPPGEWNFHDRDYCRIHEERADAGLKNGAPSISNCDGEPSTALSR